jgi:hypothetical protein
MRSFIFINRKTSLMVPWIDTAHHSAEVDDSGRRCYLVMLLYRDQNINEENFVELK